MDREMYMAKCNALSKLYKEASETGQYFQIKTDSISWCKAGRAPSINDNLANWRINPKSYMEKYIELGLDCEFRENIFDNLIFKISKLKLVKNNLFYDAHDNEWDYCRLRENHMHWWNTGSIDPIPDNCEFRVFTFYGKMSKWIDYKESSNYSWDYMFESPHAILAFEIRYIKE